MEVQKETSVLEGLPRIVAFSRDKPASWTCMHEMLERIGKFALEFCPDTVPAFLVESVMQDFVHPKPGFLLIGAMDEDYKIIGHCLACISTPSWSHKRRCLILQYALDENLPINFLKAALEIVIDFAKEQYCDTIIAETKNEKAKRAFTMFYGFETDMVQVKRSI